MSNQLPLAAHTVSRAGLPLAYSVFIFPGGEVGLKIDTANHKVRLPLQFCPFKIVARVRCSDHVMELLMLTDAVRRWAPEVPIDLILAYVPYGRQDRVCVPGEAFSLRVFADLINAQDYQSVTVFDPHSDVTPAVLKRCRVITQSTIISQFDEFNARLLANDSADKPVFVSPDAGANKKTAELAGFYGHYSFLRADKLRDLATGRIKEIVVVNPREEVEGRDCMIVDDLIDKGGTFMGLAKALRAKGARRVELYVTYGLFTGPTEPLFQSGIDHIWTTNTYRTDLGQLLEPRLTVLDIESDHRFHL